MKEIYKDIPGYEGYQASNLGNIRSIDRLVKFKTTSVKAVKGQMLKRRISKGYYDFTIYSNKKAKHYLGHQLVAMAFLDHVPCGHKSVVDHINGNKLDNRLVNLRIITARENSYTHHVGTSKYRGIDYVKRSGKWRARIQIDGNDMSLGHYKTELEAHEAYQNKLNDIIIKF